MKTLNWCKIKPAKEPFTVANFKKTQYIDQCKDWIWRECYMQNKWEAIAHFYNILKKEIEIFNAAYFRLKKSFSFKLKIEFENRNFPENLKRRKR